MLLGELLVQDRIVMPAQVGEALEAQVLHGGRIGTNLLELGYLTEEPLARALGKQHRMPCAHGEIVPSAEALRLLEANVADEKDVLPVRLEGGKLYLLVIDPDDIETIDRVATLTDKRVVPVVVAEFRMAQLQRRYSNAFRPVREVDLAAARKKHEAAQAALRAQPKADLMPEAEFDTLYAAAMTGQAPRLAGAPPPKEELEEALIVEELPEGELLPLEPEPAPPPVVPIEVAPPVPDQRHLPDRRVAPPAPHIPERRRRARRAERPMDSRPLFFAEAQKALASITDREDIARVVLRFAAGKFRRALLLSVQRDSAIGWIGAGSMLSPEVARRVAISLAKPSAFKLVRDSRSHFLGPLRHDLPSVMFLRALGGEGEPKTSLLMPILAAGRVVNILYADNGPGEFTPPDVGELLILALKVGRSYEAMIASRRAAAAVLGRG